MSETAISSAAEGALAFFGAGSWEAPCRASAFGPPPHPELRLVLSAPAFYAKWAGAVVVTGPRVGGVIVVSRRRMR